MSGSTTLRDGRIPPFSYVTHAALEALHREFTGPERGSAMALCFALAAMASRERANGNHGGFEATKGEVGEDAGLSAKTVERLMPRFEAAGLLVVEHRRGRASVWMLVEPGQQAELDERPAPEPVEPATPCRDPEEGPATPCRDTRDTMSRHPRHHVAGLVKAPAGRAERTEEEEVEREARAPSSTVSPGERICELLEQHVLELDPAATPSVAADDWLREADALLEDGRTVDQVLDVIAWVRRDPFWSGRVLSPRHLRKHIAQIVAIQAGSKAIGHKDQTARERRDRREEEQHADAGACCLEDGSPPLAAEDEWRTMAPEVRASVGDDQFDLWLSAAHAHSGGDGELLIGVPRVAMGWVRDRFAPVFARVAGRKVDVVYCERGCP